MSPVHYGSDEFEKFNHRYTAQFHEYRRLDPLSPKFGEQGLKLLETIRQLRVDQRKLSDVTAQESWSLHNAIDCLYHRLRDSVIAWDKGRQSLAKGDRA